MSRETWVVVTPGGAPEPSRWGPGMLFDTPQLGTGSPRRTPAVLRGGGTPRCRNCPLWTLVSPAGPPPTDLPHFPSNPAGEDLEGAGLLWLIFHDPVVMFTQPWLRRRHARAVPGQRDPTLHFARPPARFMALRSPASLRQDSSLSRIPAGKTALTPSCGPRPSWSPSQDISVSLNVYNYGPWEALYTPTKSCLNK